MHTLRPLASLWSRFSLPAALVAWATLALLVCPAAAWGEDGELRPERRRTESGVEVWENLEYARLPGGRTLRLDLYRSAGSRTRPPAPCVVYIHGGGWEGGDKRLGIAGAGRYVQAGYAVASVEYRLSREARFPAQIHDVKRAIRFLRRRAGALRIDPDRLCAFGVSAGGHLALLAGFTDPKSGLEPPPDGGPPVSTRVQAVASWAGPTDLLHCETPKNRKTVRRLLRKLLGATATEAPALYRKASPLSYVTADDPPVFLVHGAEDELVIPAQALALRLALRKAGVLEKTVLCANMGHGNQVGSNPVTPSLDEVMRRFLEFLGKRLRNAPVLR